MWGGSASDAASSGRNGSTSMDARHIFILHDTAGKAVDSNCFEDTQRFFKDMSRNVSDTTLSEWSEGRRFYPAHSAFVAPGGHALHMLGEVEDNITKVKAQLTKQHHKFIGICAGGALGAKNLAEPTSSYGIPMLGLSSTSAKGPMKKSPELFEISSGDETYQQLGWDNIAFADTGHADTVVATYPEKEFGYTNFHSAAVRNNDALLFGYHPEAAITRSKLFDAADEKIGLGGFWDWESEAAKRAALKSSQKIVRDFL